MLNAPRSLSTAESGLNMQRSEKDAGAAIAPDLAAQTNESVETAVNRKETN
jgi:hypothetical protein